MLFPLLFCFLFLSPFFLWVRGEEGGQGLTNCCTRPLHFWAPGLFHIPIRSPKGLKKGRIRGGLTFFPSLIFHGPYLQHIHIPICSLKGFQTDIWMVKMKQKAFYQLCHFFILFLTNKSRYFQTCMFYNHGGNKPYDEAKKDTKLRIYSQRNQLVSQ